MSLFVISDTHLSHAVDKPMDIFGSRWHYYVEKITDGWQRTVTDDDTVVIGGDISWAMTLDEALPDFQYLSSLPGKKLIGRGNHDYWWNTASKMSKFFFDEHQIKNISFLYNNAFVAEGFTICGSRGWFNDSSSSPHGIDYQKIIAREAMRIELSISEGKKLNIRDGRDREILLFLHFPPIFGSYCCNEIIDVLKKHDIKRCYYGHIHNVFDIAPSFTYEGIDFTITSADYLNFFPLKIENRI